MSLTYSEASIDDVTKTPVTKTTVDTKVTKEVTEDASDLESDLDSDDLEFEEFDYRTVDLFYNLCFLVNYYENNLAPLENDKNY